MIRRIGLVAAAVVVPVALVVTAGIAGASKGPSAATDTATCTGLQGTVNFSIPLTNSGVTSGTETSTVSGSLSGCTASGSYGVTLSGATFSGTISGKPASAKHPGATCAGLVGTNKEKGTLTTSWSSSPPVAPTVLTVKTVTSGVDNDNNGTFAVAGKYKGSFGGSDKGKSSTTSAETVETTSEILAQCAGSGVSSLQITTPDSGNPVVLQ